MRLADKITIVGIGVLFVFLVGMIACDGPDDLTLGSNIKAKLAADKTIPIDSIKVAVQGGVVTLSGAVGSEAEKSRAEQIAKSVLGVDSVVNNITVKPATAAPVPQPALFASAPVNTKATVQEATQKASNALAELKPGFTAQELVKALNLEIINFPSGSAQIPRENTEILKKSAETIKTAPKGTVLEVGGYTDNTGNAAANEKLSQRRAEAVRAFLIKQGVSSTSLTSKGYGESKPVAGNDTEEGRFKNRRIEYAVVK